MESNLTWPERHGAEGKRGWRDERGGMTDELCCSHLWKEHFRKKKKIHANINRYFMCFTDSLIHTHIKACIVSKFVCPCFGRTIFYTRAYIFFFIFCIIHFSPHLLLLTCEALRGLQYTLVGCVLASLFPKCFTTDVKVRRGEQHISLWSLKSSLQFSRFLSSRRVKEKFFPSEYYMNKCILCISIQRLLFEIIVSIRFKVKLSTGGWACNQAFRWKRAIQILPSYLNINKHFLFFVEKREIVS